MTQLPPEFEPVVDPNPGNPLRGFVCALALEASCLLIIYICWRLR